MLKVTLLLKKGEVEVELVWLSREDVESKSKVMSFGRRRLSWNCGSL